MTPYARRVRHAIIATLCPVVLGCSHMPHFGSRQNGKDIRNVGPAQAADIQIALGRSLESEGNIEKAMFAYKEAARKDPKRADAPLRLAILLDRLGKFNESSPYYEAALKANPGDPEIFCDRGYSLCLQGRDTEAETALRQAIAKKPDMARAHNNLGLLLGRSGRVPEALTEFRKAGCPEADAELNLAFALGQNRRWSEAKEHVEIARSLGANLPNVKEGVAEIDALIARAEAAPTSLAGSDPAVLRAKATQSVPK